MFRQIAAIVGLKFLTILKTIYIVITAGYRVQYDQSFPKFCYLFNTLSAKPTKWSAVSRQTV